MSMARACALAACLIGCAGSEAKTNPDVDELGTIQPTVATKVLTCPPFKILKARLRKEANDERVASYPGDLAKVAEAYSAQVAKTFDVIEAFNASAACGNFEDAAIWSDAIWTFANPKVHEVMKSVATERDAKTLFVPVVHATELKCAGANVYECWEGRVRVGLFLFDDQGKLLWKHQRDVVFDEPGVGDASIKARRTDYAINVVLSELPDAKLARRDLRDANLKLDEPPK